MADARCQPSPDLRSIHQIVTIDAPDAKIQTVGDQHCQRSQATRGVNEGITVWLS